MDMRIRCGLDVLDSHRKVKLNKIQNNPKNILDTILAHTSERASEGLIDLLLEKIVRAINGSKKLFYRFTTNFSIE